MKPCPFCGEQIQDAAVKCRFCFEWLDPSKRPSRSSDEPSQAERAEPGPPAHALHEVARAAVTPQPRAEPTHPNREISQAKPIGTFLDRGRPGPGSVGPDERGRAGGVLQVGEPPASPAVTPRFQAPGGEPATRPRPEWQPAQAAGPGAWRPPVEPEPEPPAQAQAATEPPAGAWTPPTWLMEESRPAPESTARMPVGPTLASPTVDPAWGPPAAATLPPATPAWVAPDHTWTPGTHPPAAAPALANTSDDEFEDVPVGPAVAHERARLEPVAVRPAPATGPTAQPAAGTPEPTRGPRRRERIHVALEDDGPQAERPSDPPSSPAPVATPPASTPAKTKPHHDDDDDDDFGDDFGDDDDAEASSGMSGGGMSTIARPSRKFPWLPVAAVSGVLVLVLGFVFQDELLGITDETSDDVEAGVDSAAEPEPTAPEPDPTPVEPEPQDPPTTGAPEPPPVEPPPPAIDPVELAAKLAEADAFYQKAKHEKAREVLDAILAKSPREPGALALLAQVLLETSDFETALATANLCIGADPTQPNCWITIAVVEQQNKNLPRALEGYRKYLEAAPEGRFAKDAKKQITRLAKEVEG